MFGFFDSFLMSSVAALALPSLRHATYIIHSYIHTSYIIHFLVIFTMEVI